MKSLLTLLILVFSTSAWSFDISCFDISKLDKVSGKYNCYYAVSTSGDLDDIEIKDDKNNKSNCSKIGTDNTLYFDHYLDKKEKVVMGTFFEDTPYVLYKDSKENSLLFSDVNLLTYQTSSPYGGEIIASNSRRSSVRLACAKPAKGKQVSKSTTFYLR